MHVAESKVCESGGQEASKSLEGITLANILVFGLSVQVICWDRGRPARKRAEGAKSL